MHKDLIDTHTIVQYHRLSIVLTYVNSLNVDLQLFES